MTSRSLLGRLHGWITDRTQGSRENQRSSVPTVRFADLPAADIAGIQVACPNCGSVAGKALLLQVDDTPPLREPRTWNVVVCPDCTCRFYEQPQLQDYGTDAMHARGRAELYLQQGAGVGQLCLPVGRLRRLAGSRYLDVGCGFGFGLDYACRAKLWRGQGIDPGQIARMGRDRLGLPIALRLLGDDEPDLHSACDVVMAAETIEHVPSPAAFLAILKATLAPDGVLVLTTPDGAALRPETSPGQLVPLLSPGLHIVLQTEASLLGLLRRAGFAHIRIERDGCTLTAHASEAAFELESDDTLFRDSLRRYLEDRSLDVGADRDLLFGFAGRALLEAANDGDLERAARLRPRLGEACRRHFGLDLTGITTLPAETATCSLARMAELVPLNLAAILYADAMCALAEGAARPSLEQQLDCAAEAARRLRRATGELAMEDAMSEDLEWVARSEALLCRAEAGGADITSRLAALPASPGEGGTARRQTVMDRAFVTLVNAGHYKLAAAMAESDATMPTARVRDVMFCRAILNLHHHNDASAAQTGFARVRQGLSPSDGLFWAALRGEVRAWTLLDKPAAAAALCRDIEDSLGETEAAMPEDLALISRSA